MFGPGVQGLGMNVSEQLCIAHSPKKQKAEDGGVRVVHDHLEKQKVEGESKG